MSFTQVLSESGYVLHRRPYRETSLLMDIFTHHYGRISVIAKGVRKTITKNKPNLQLFTEYDFSWRGKTELYTLTQVESQGAAHLFSPYQLCCGLYINELLLRVLSREDPYEDIYIAYQKLLQDLKSIPLTQISLRIFEKKLLQSIGYGLCLENILPEAFYRFEVSAGFLQVKEKTADSLSGESLIALSNQTLEEKHLPEIKRLMRRALSPLMGEKPLKSRELFI